MADFGGNVSISTSPFQPSKPSDSTDELPPQLSLSSDQFRNCSRALQLFNEKLQNPGLIRDEFRSLQVIRLLLRMQEKRITTSEMASQCAVAIDQVNLSKNRYPDVLPFDSTRVVLNSCKDYRPSARGYINASFVKTPVESSAQFIATQGPLPHTFEDFWEMVFQYRCPAIVMLTRLVDGFKMVKCGNYFEAEDGPREFGNISVITKSIQTTNNSLVLRHQEVTKAEAGSSGSKFIAPMAYSNWRSEQPPLSVLHIQYPDWPDHGVPRTTLAVREIFKRTYRLSTGLGPIVVHCSAGIGRTGTYCTIHDTIQRILAGDVTALDVAKTVEIFRSQRIGMVQTLDQYEYCYQVVVDELEELISGYNAEKK
ncbi:hypothetical protein Cgig2_029530 [Carnegiea gigantea]|uniref:protein-tyrosine-phosphatase n=1 Tax=Carnegiea gigantea TaxID=171969 RepID=A0A9Q1KLW0_9CARY|nr:hypothetical protein Cgig2_029530 [Carnegiea gigantea]